MATRDRGSHFHVTSPDYFRCLRAELTMVVVYMHPFAFLGDGGGAAIPQWQKHAAAYLRSGLYIPI